MSCYSYVRVAVGSFKLRLVMSEAEPELKANAAAAPAQEVVGSKKLTSQTHTSHTQQATGLFRSKRTLTSHLASSAFHAKCAPGEKEIKRVQA